MKSTNTKKIEINNDLIISIIKNQNLEKEWERLLIRVMLTNNIGIKIFKALNARGNNIFPKAELCFKAFKECPYSKLNTVILGEAPYDTTKKPLMIPIADGLAYSCSTNLTDDYIPFELEMILQEVETDVKNGLDLNKRMNTDLTRWANQGVLLLNTALTVEKGHVIEHIAIWKEFTKTLIEELVDNEIGLIWVLWGDQFNEYLQYIDKKYHDIIQSPSPGSEAAVESSGFLGSRPFSKINEIIEARNGKEFTINW